MITFRDVTKRYGDLVVYEGFDFDIAEGEITCILGESGSGKTTLLNMIAGLTPYSGSISPRPSCSYVFQQPRLVPSLTVLGNLKLVCGDAAKARAMLAEAGLSSKADAYPAKPFSSLDIAVKLKMAALFIRLWQSERRTAVFVTHDADEALMLANRIVVLKGGRVAAEFRPEGSPCADLFARQSLRSELIGALL